MKTKYHKGHNWRKRKLKYLLKRVVDIYENDLSSYEEMCQITWKMWEIAWEAPSDSGLRQYHNSAYDLCRERDWECQRRDALWEVYG